MWPWFTPMTANFSRAGRAGSGEPPASWAAEARAAPAPAPAAEVVQATPAAVVIDDFRNSRRPRDLLLMAAVYTRLFVSLTAGGSMLASLLAALALFAAAASTPAAALDPPSGLNPPVARKEPHKTLIHGETLVDDYYWLRNKGTPEVESYLKAELAYADAFMK